MRRDERGSSLPLMVLAVALAGVLALEVGRMGGTAGARARAQTAADAAALAGAADGEGAARSLAELNGARVVSFQRQGTDTRVVVELGPAQAVGKARREANRRVVSSGGGGGAGAVGGGSTTGLAPAMVAALSRAAQLLGEPVPITSGFRSREQQQRLWDNRGSNPYPVAVPGTSMHERGLAVDVPVSFVARLARVAPQAGLCHPFPQSDPVHFEVCQ